MLRYRHNASCVVPVGGSLVALMAAASRALAADAAQPAASCCPVAAHLDGIVIGALAVLLVIGVVVTRRRVPPVVPAPPAAPPVADDAPAPADDVAPAIPGGPGPLVVRLQDLCAEFTLTTQDVAHYGHQREVQLQQWQRTCVETLRRMLPVLDNLEPYLDDAEPQVAEVAQLAHGRLRTELASLGVKPIHPQPGEPFDGTYHQLDPDVTGLPPYTIVETVVEGYLFTPRAGGIGEIVLRPAEVRAAGVAETDAELAAETEDDPGKEDAGDLLEAAADDILHGDAEPDALTPPATHETPA